MPIPSTLKDGLYNFFMEYPGTLAKLERAMAENRRAIELIKQGDPTEAQEDIHKAFTVKQIRLDLEEALADVELRFRSMSDPPFKLTESAIDALIKGDSRVRSLKQQILDAERLEKLHHVTIGQSTEPLASLQEKQDELLVQRKELQAKFEANQQLILLLD